MIRLRPAEPHDSWLFFQLRKQVQPDLELAEHDLWWTNVFEHRFVAYDGPVMVGIIRISVKGALSLIVTKSERGKGLGTDMLMKIKPAAEKRGFTRLYATVCEGNTASQRAFTTAGYIPTRFEVGV